MSPMGLLTFNGEPHLLSSRCGGAQPLNCLSEVIFARPAGSLKRQKINQLRRLWLPDKNLSAVRADGALANKR
jgi:uncharacterized protein (DUF58 family)